MNNTNTDSNEFEVFTDLTKEMLTMIQRLSNECKELQKEVCLLKKKQDTFEQYFSLSFNSTNDMFFQNIDEKIITLVFVYNKPVLYFSLLMKFIEVYDTIVSKGLFVNPIHSIETELNNTDYDNTNSKTYDMVNYYLTPFLHTQLRNRSNPTQHVDIISINLKETMVQMLKKLSIIIRNNEFSFMNIYDNNGFDITSSFHIVQSETKKICITF